MFSLFFSPKARLSGLLGLLVFFLAALAGCRESNQTASPAADPAAGPVYRIGYMVCNSEQETLERFEPVSAYLSQQLGVRFESVAIDTVGFTRHLEELDFTHTNSILYIMMQRLHGVEILAAEKAGSLGYLSQGAIAVRSDSDIMDLAGLKDRTMLFGPMYAPTAYMSQIDLLLSNGFDPEEHLGLYSIPNGSFKHEKVIYGVLFGRAEAGAFPMLDYERMLAAGKIEAGDFRILALAPPIAYCNFAATQRVDPQLALRVRETLLAITPETTVTFNGETIRVLSRADVDGYELVDDTAFDGVREMARRTNMPPYQKY